MKQHALDLAHLGLVIFPLRPNSKVPLTLHGYKDASNNLDLINSWWSEYPDANIGLPTGKVNSIVVVDVDVKDDRPGEYHYDRLFKNHPSKYWVHTPSKGAHIYYRYAGPIANKANFGKCDKYPVTGLDIRGDGGYVVALGSAIDGLQYHTTDKLCLAELADFPMHVLSVEELNHKATRHPQGEFSGKVHPRARKALMEECRKVMGAGKGERNHQLFKSLACMFELEAAGDIDEGSISSSIRQAASSYIEEDGEWHFQSTYESARLKGRASPREPAEFKTFDVGGRAILAPPSNSQNEVPVPSSPLIKGGEPPRNQQELGVRSNTAGTGGLGNMGTSGIIDFSRSGFQKDEVWLFEELTRRKDGGFDPIPSPVGGLNDLLGGGACRAGVTLLCGPPGSGKTSFAVDWALHASRTGRFGAAYPSIVWSLEMPKIDIYSRIVSLETGESWGKIRSGEHNEQFREVWNSILEYPMHVVDQEDVGSLDAMELYYQAAVEHYGNPPLLVVDYAQLMFQALKSDDSRITAEASSRALLNLARKHAAPVLALSSTGRASYNILKKNNRPDISKALSMARESGQFEFDASAVIGMSLVPDVEVDGCKVGWLCVGKNRLGGGTGAVPVQFDGKRGRYSETSDTAIPDDKEDDIDNQIAIVLALVVKNNYSSRNYIAQDMGVRRCEALRAIKLAVEQGQLGEPDNHSPYFYKKVR